MVTPVTQTRWQLGSWSASPSREICFPCKSSHYFDGKTGHGAFDGLWKRRLLGYCLAPEGKMACHLLALDNSSIIVNTDILQLVIPQKKNKNTLQVIMLLENKQLWGGNTSHILIMDYFPITGTLLSFIPSVNQEMTGSEHTWSPSFGNVIRVPSFQPGFTVMVKILSLMLDVWPSSFIT